MSDASKELINGYLMPEKPENTVITINGIAEMLLGRIPWWSNPRFRHAKRAHVGIIPRLLPRVFTADKLSPMRVKEFSHEGKGVSISTL
jgi:hypothetical protein